MAMKRVLSFAAILLLIFCLCSCDIQEEQLKPTNEFYVNDFADVITPEHEAEMLARSVALNEKTTAQVVTLTVESLDGQEPSEYALDIGREWGIGAEDKDNGILILLSESDRQIYIAVGYGLEGALPDSKTGRIIDIYGLEYLKTDNFSEGLRNISKAVVNEVYIEYGLEPETDYTPIDLLNDTDSLSESGGSVLVSWIIMIIIVFIIFFFGGRGGRRRRGGFWYGGPKMYGGFHGSSFGSSGRSGGFGGGGFSGGGGSFGGGGAGRGF